MLAVATLSPAVALAQLAGSNLLLGQVGNYPDRSPKNRQDLYDQLGLDYGFGTGRVGLRFETDRNSEEQFVYEGIAQRWAEWTEDHGRVRVGNFYTILGRGLIHRSFELPGVVLDEIGIRSRYAFSREMDGALLEGHAGPVEGRLFSGTANGGINSLAAEKIGLPRYQGQFNGAQLAVAPWRDAKVGAAYLRSNFGNNPQQEFGSGFVDLDPLALANVSGVSLPLYFEYAQQNGSLGDWWRMRHDSQTPHALYGSVGLIRGRLGLTAEWKDYARFRSGTNDPPSLVREQSYTLLNRVTHVLDADRETGYQIEATYGPTSWATLTGNVSRGEGETINRHRERYVEARIAPAAQRWEASAYYDEGRDLLSFLDDAHTYGAEGALNHLGPFSSRLDVERQTAEHPNVFGPAQRFENFLLSLNVTRADWGSVAVIWDRTSDPLVRSVFGGGGAFLHLLSGVVNARLSSNQEATLTFGKQRGGRQCTAGTCYEVQPFVGAELRLLSRF
jgi:hypothetical protein